MTIKELILKDNIIISGYPLKFYVGLSVPVTNGIENPFSSKEPATKECFVSGIKYYSKDSDFVKERGLSFGCYVISIAESSEDFCLKNNSKESYMIMEDVVAMILFTN